MQNQCHKQQTNLCTEPTWVRCYNSNSDGQFFSWKVQRPFKQSRDINSTKPIHPMLYLEETLAFMKYHSGTTITEKNQVVDFKITRSIPVFIRLKESQLLQMFWSHFNNCSVLFYFQRIHSAIVTGKCSIICNTWCKFLFVQSLMKFTKNNKQLVLVLTLIF